MAPSRTGSPARPVPHPSSQSWRVKACSTTAERPLSRCAALAHELVPTRAAVMTPDLLELDFGSWEGRAWEDVPRVELDAWARDPWAYAPGGGESARSAFERFQRWTLRLRGEGHDTVVAVTHAGLIRLAMAAGSKDPSGLALSVPYGSVHRVLL